MARRTIAWLWVLFTLATVGCDHATKGVAHAVLERRGAVPIVPGYLDLHYAENHDTAFSLLRAVEFPGKAALLATLATLSLVAVVAMWWRRRDGAAVEQAAFALIVAGAIGNVIDRAHRGFVVDFIEIHRWPIFNVADIAVVAGAILLGVVSLRRDVAAG